jgi:hypothetical protein
MIYILAIEIMGKEPNLQVLSVGTQALFGVMSSFEANAIQTMSLKSCTFLGEASVWVLQPRTRLIGDRNRFQLSKLSFYPFSLAFFFSRVHLNKRFLDFKFLTFIPSLSSTLRNVLHPLFGGAQGGFAAHGSSLLLGRPALASSPSLPQLPTST